MKTTGRKKTEPAATVAAPVAPVTVSLQINDDSAVGLSYEADKPAQPAPVAPAPVAPAPVAPAPVASSDKPAAPDMGSFAGAKIVMFIRTKNKDTSPDYGGFIEIGQSKYSFILYLSKLIEDGKGKGMIFYSDGHAPVMFNCIVTDATNLDGNRPAIKFDMNVQQNSGSYKVALWKRNSGNNEPYYSGLIS